MTFQTIMDTLKKVDADTILLLCHKNADPDTLCSAYALSKLLKKVEPGLMIEIATPHGLSKLSKQIIKHIPIALVDLPLIDKVDVIFLLDTNTLEQLGSWKIKLEEFGKPLIIIDHHIIHPHTKRVSAVSIVDEHAVSTCEIIFELYKQANVKLDEKEALALFLGITYDTKHFTIATSKTFKMIVELIKAGINVEESMRVLSTDMDSSERIARLKAANRLNIVKMGKWLITFSSINSYHASAARALLSLGAHIAIIGGEKKRTLVISMRASKAFYEETKIHLGRDIAQPLGEYLHGMGGGHNTSAGVNGNGVLQDAFQECIRLLEKLTN